MEFFRWVEEVICQLNEWVFKNVSCESKDIFQPMSTKDTLCTLRSINQCDVLVIGGGPAGSSISALLAEKGWKVAVLEKSHHPRFHIGESLLPFSLSYLERLGVMNQIEEIGIRKYGAELISPVHDKPTTLYFSQAMDKSFPYAYQVRRSEFDEILLRNCSMKGATVYEGLNATQVDFSENQSIVVTAVDSEKTHHTWECQFLVDASGRDTFLSSHLGTKQRSQTHNSAAIFGHFEGAQRHSGKDEGNITIAWFAQGWCWFIPFKDGTTSVGAVCWPSYLKKRQTDLDTFLWDTLAQCTSIAQRLTHAKLVVPASATGNYSYQGAAMTGPNYLLVGDAFGFIDPVFSSGVHLALHSAFQGAEVVHAHLTKSKNFPSIRQEFEWSVQKSLRLYSWFISRFTQPAFRNLFMAPRNIFHMEEAILSVLSGDIFGNTPTRIPLSLFKLAYYFTLLQSPVNNFEAYRLRKQGV